MYSYCTRTSWKCTKHHEVFNISRHNNMLKQEQCRAQRKPRVISMSSCTFSICLKFSNHRWISKFAESFCVSTMAAVHLYWRNLIKTFASVNTPGLLSIKNFFIKFSSSYDAGGREGFPVKSNQIKLNQLIGLGSSSFLNKFKVYFQDKTVFGWHWPTLLKIYL